MNYYHYLGKFMMAIAVIVVFAISPVLRAQELTVLSKSGIHLIPYPQEVTLKGADFRLDRNVAIIIDRNATASDKFAAEELRGYLRSELNINAQVQTNLSGNSIVLTRRGADRKLGDQGYHLTAASGQISIGARGEAGLFYGVQTLM
jgi:hexosaminidase